MFKEAGCPYRTIFVCLVYPFLAFVCVLNFWITRIFTGNVAIDCTNHLIRDLLELLHFKDIK